MFRELLKRKGSSRSLRQGSPHSQVNTALHLQVLPKSFMLHIYSGKCMQSDQDDQVTPETPDVCCYAVSQAQV